MKRPILAFLALLAPLMLLSLGGGSSVEHSFAQTDYVNTGSERINGVPPAPDGTTSVTITVMLERRFTGSVEGSGQFVALMAPDCEMGLPQPLTLTLPPFAVSYTLTGGAESYQNADGQEHTVTYTDAATVDFFKYPPTERVVIPLNFRGGYRSTWIGGLGSQSIYADYRWSGTIRYDGP